MKYIMSPEGPTFESREQVERKDWGIALRVSQDCEREAFRIRDAIREAGVELDIALERDPHVTLFQGEFSSTSLQKIEEAVTEVLEKFSQNLQQEPVLEMETGLYLRAGNNNLFWNVASTEWLANLHAALDERLRSLPEWSIMKQFRDRIAQGELTPVELEHVQKYGVLSAGQFFLPHITIGRLKSSADFERIKSISIQPISFVAEQLMTGVIDRYGRIESVKATSSI